MYPATLREGRQHKAKSEQSQADGTIGSAQTEFIRDNINCFQWLSMTDRGYKCCRQAKTANYCCGEKSTKYLLYKMCDQLEYSFLQLAAWFNQESHINLKKIKSFPWPKL